MITAVFTDNSDYARATGLWQWDYGRRLRIEGLHLPTAVEIHFALTEQSGDAITRVGTTKDGVTEVVIPESLLEHQAAGATYEIYAWIYLADKISGETIKRISMQVKRRPKPEAFDAPEDAELFREAIEAVNASADRAETAREGAEAAKKAAEEAAGKIESEITGAGQIAEQVKQDAEAVAKDKQAVAQMVTETTQNAQNAAEAAQAAERSSTAAKEAQTAAERAEVGAESAMEEVERDRTEVSETHRLVEQMREAVDTDRQAVAADRRAVENTALQFGQAAQNAINAVGQAQDAAVGAVSAEGQRQTTAVQQAGTHAVSGVTAAKTEAVQAVTTEGDTQTKRVQDAAAGIVADREQIAANKQAIEGKVDKQQGADNAGKALVVGKDGNVELGDAQTKTDPTLTQPGQAADAQVTGREIATLHQKKADAIVETAQGETMTLTDSSDKLFEGLRVFGKSTQDGTPSVENPVPIVNAGEGGSIKVEVTGRNLFDVNKIEETWNGSYGIKKNNNGALTMASSPNDSSISTNKTLKELCPQLKVGETYILDAINSGNAHKIYLTAIKKMWEYRTSIVITDEVLNSVVRFYISANTNDSGTIRNIQVNKGKTVLPYEPYRKPQSLAISTPNGLPGVPVTKDGNYTDKDGQQWICDEIDLGRRKYIQRVAEKDVLESQKQWPGTGLWGNVDGGSTLSFLSYINGSNGELNWGGVNNVGMCNYFVRKNGVFNNSEIGFSISGYIAFRVPRELLPDWDESSPSNEPWINWLRKKKEEGNPVRIRYILATPIERDLTPEELAAYSSLHTNYSTTVITNDAGAHMEASYVADTGTYIRNMESRLNAKLVNIQSALISQKISGGGIKVTDSSRVPVVRFAMWGKTEQVRTSGKNLIDIPEISKDTEQVTIPCNISKPVFFSCRVEDVAVKTNVWRVRFKYKNNELVYLSDINIGAGKNINVTDDNPIIEIVYRGINIESGRYTDIQLEYGSSATAYEPYTGGKPSPSPDYPQPIEITDQPVTVTVKGGTEQQSITLSPPKPMTKWDKLEKVDGVWCWVYQTKKYTVTGEEVFAKGGDSYVQGSSTSFYTSKDIGDPVGADSSLMNRLTKNEIVWSKPGEIGYTLNVNQLHMRFLNTTLGVSDDATEVEKKTAYANYLKAEYAKGTPYELLYAVKESKLIPLSPSEQDKLNALTMYAPETEVTNTGGCNMELTYTVDTKSYVDSKIAAISAAVLEV